MKQLPAVRTEREWIRDRLLERARGNERAKFVDRWKQDALATWQAFRAQHQQAQSRPSSGNSIMRGNSISSGHALIARTGRNRDTLQL